MQKRKNILKAAQDNYGIANSFQYYKAKKNPNSAELDFAIQQQLDFKPCSPIKKIEPASEFFVPPKQKKLTVIPIDSIRSSMKIKAVNKPGFTEEGVKKSENMQVGKRVSNATTTTKSSLKSSASTVKDPFVKTISLGKRHSVGSILPADSSVVDTSIG